jgi:hypothetical protein
MMADHDGWCACPLLRVQAEIERMAADGMLATDSVQGRMLTAVPLVVGRLRERYGCRGPERNGFCPWSDQLYVTGMLLPEPGVPEVRRRYGGRSSGTGEYL